MDKIRLYTCQMKNVCDILDKEGVVHVRREHIAKKYEEVAGIFLEAYDWYINNASVYSEKTEGSQYPYWAFTTSDLAGLYPGSCLLTLDVPVEKTVLFRSEDWNKILNFRYIGKTQEEEEKFRKKVRDQGIAIDMDIFSKPFYAMLKSEVKRSWNNLFRFNDELKAEDKPGYGIQAGLWEIRKEWVTDRVCK